MSLANSRKTQFPRLARLTLGSGGRGGGADNQTANAKKAARGEGTWHRNTHARKESRSCSDQTIHSARRKPDEGDTSAQTPKRCKCHRRHLAQEKQATADDLQKEAAERPPGERECCEAGPIVLKPEGRRGRQRTNTKPVMQIRSKPNEGERHRGAPGGPGRGKQWHK